MTTHDDTTTPDATDAQTCEDCSALRHQLEQLQGEADRLKDIAARSQADLQNAKARVERESEASRKYATEETLRRLLPTIDNFQRAFQHLPEELRSHEWIQGVLAIEQSLLRELQALGLERMSSLGQPIDPQRHDVLQAGPGPADTVAAVFEEGYVLHDRILRPAKVMAGNGEPSTDFSPATA